MRKTSVHLIHTYVSLTNNAFKFNSYAKYVTSAHLTSHQRITPGKCGFQAKGKLLQPYRDQQAPIFQNHEGRD